MINVGTLELEIQKKISESSSSRDILILTTALNILKTGKITSVYSFWNLPTNIQTPDLYYVEQDAILYFYSTTERQWIPVYSTALNDLLSFGRGIVSGDGTTFNRANPVSVIGGFTDWCHISLGIFHAAAVRSNGTAWAWGINNCGQLGTGQVGSQSSPVSVIGGFTDWCQISAGGCHTAGLRKNGTIWTWGIGTAGGLGDGTVVTKLSPVSIVGNITNWRDVSAGNTRTMALRSDGTLWGWGFNTAGNIGDNTVLNRSSPVSVVGGITDWCKFNSGREHVLAIRSDGTLWSWGFNGSGELGHGTATTCNRSSPVQVVGGFNDWCQVSGGNAISAAIRTNGSLWTWGFNSSGQLGQNCTANRCSPVSVVGGFTDWCQVSAGSTHMAAIRTNGTLWSWGSNTCCQLGIGSATPTLISSPASVVGGIAEWCDVSLGNYSSTALRSRIF